MSSLAGGIRSVLRNHLVRTSLFEGSQGKAWFAGSAPRAPSIAAYFCGDDVSPASRGLLWRRRLPDRLESYARSGGLASLRLSEPDPSLTGLLRHAVAVPSLVDIHTHLPDDRDALREQLKTSTTKEDFRRIRKAGFDYHVTNDPDAIREFHERHYKPLVEKQFPEDGRVTSVDGMLDRLPGGGELVCADIDESWVAGIFNIPDGDVYAMTHLGIRDADETVRGKRVVAALIVRSLERAVELGHERATLGRSLPFLGKGPVWFKVKWGGVISRDPATPDMHMFMDLRHTSVRQMLSRRPVIHREGDALVVSKWLEAGDRALQTTIRETERFTGISRWYVLGEPKTIADGGEELSSDGRITGVSITPEGSSPLWLGDVLSSSAVPAQR